MESGPTARSHPWSWIRWVALGLFVIFWVPSAFNLRLAWIWMGYAGLLVTTLGLVMAIAPSRTLAFRHSYLERAPEWEKRLAAHSQRREPSERVIRLIGVPLLFLGLTQLTLAGFILIGA